MPISLAVNCNISVLSHLKWSRLSSTLFQNGSIKVLNEGEVKTRLQISIGTNLHYEGIVNRPIFQGYRFSNLK